MPKREALTANQKAAQEVGFIENGAIAFVSIGYDSIPDSVLDYSKKEPPKGTWLQVIISF
jgi:hypothetical protein